MKPAAGFMRTFFPAAVTLSWSRSTHWGGVRDQLRKALVKPLDRCKPLIDENNELISTVVTSIATAQKNVDKQENRAMSLHHSKFLVRYSIFLLPSYLPWIQRIFVNIEGRAPIMRLSC